MSTRLQKSIFVPHLEFEEGIVNDIMAKKGKRVLQGKRGLDDATFRQARHLVREGTRNLAGLIGRRHEFPALNRVGKVTGPRGQEVAMMLVREKYTEQRQQVIREVEAIEHQLQLIGVDSAREEIGAAVEEMEARRRQLEAQAGRQSLHRSVQAYQKSQRSIPGLILHYFNLNGKAERDLEQVLRDEVSLQTTREIVVQLRWLTSPEDSGVIPNPAPFSLPQDSPYRSELEDILLSGDDSRLVRRRMLTFVRNKLPELMTEFLRSTLRQSLRPDYRVEQDVVETQGLVIRSKLVHQLRWIPGFFNLDLAQVKLIEAAEDVTEITAFWIVSSFTGVPELWTMVQRVEDEQRTTEDRRLCGRTVREVYPPLIGRTERGVAPDVAADLAVMVSLTRDKAEKFRKRSDRLVISIADRRKSYSNFEEFASNISLVDEKNLTDAFWTEIVEDAEGKSRKLSDIAAGQLGTGEAAVRLQSLKRFVGVTRWDEAVQRIGSRVNNTKQYL